MFAERLQIISEKMEAAHRRSGRAAEDRCALIAVSKTHPPEALLEAVRCGVTLFGENRVQEAKAKVPLLPTHCRWHFIGHLQKNKIRQALPLFDLLHGVDSVAIARDIDRIALESGLFPKILLEVNVAGESSKFGFRPDQLESQIDDLLTLSHLHIDGLMTIPPVTEDPEHSRKHFVALRELRDRLQARAGLRLPVLSMGMSDDFAVAIEEGASLVRIGTALFGERSGKTWKPTGIDSLDE